MSSSTVSGAADPLPSGGGEQTGPVSAAPTLALRLADLLQAGADDPMWADHCEMSKRTASLAAAELRRLSSVNEELLESLKYIDKEFRKHGRQHWPEAVKARAAIAKYEAKQRGEA
jgi:hypothetical protein